MTETAPRFDMDAPDLAGASRSFERRAVQGLELQVLGDGAAQAT
jgi:hypothetical protein